jgi:hypothetical protein
MSVNTIVSGIYSEIAATLPDYSRARFVWELDKNTDRKPMCAVRPGAGRNVEGTNRAITIDQDFEVVLVRPYKPVGGANDNDLDAQILQLQTDQESLWRVVFQRRLNAHPVAILLVSVVDIAAPEIDNDNNTASVAVTFTVKYRTQV